MLRIDRENLARFFAAQCTTVPLYRVDPYFSNATPKEQGQPPCASNGIALVLRDYSRPWASRQHHRCCSGIGADVTDTIGYLQPATQHHGLDVHPLRWREADGNYLPAI